MTPDFPTVLADESGFRLERDGTDVVGVRWDEIQEIIAFKRDIFSYDIICLGFRVDDSETFIEVAEDFPGYKQFLKTVESRFPLKDGWWNDVAVPAFATNMMQIWARA